MREEKNKIVRVHCFEHRQFLNCLNTTVSPEGDNIYISKIFY